MASFKRLLNTEECVDDCLRGLVAAHPVLHLYSKSRVVVDTSPHGESNVAIISGGGSGHEPFAAGYVGKGMLRAAVCGSVFASPPAQHIRFAIQKAALRTRSRTDVLVITPNYTGDVLNFGLAVELARADGLRVEQVRVGEDVAVDAHAAGRRGMTGLVAVFKVCGHLASIGAPLEAVANAARQLLTHMGSIGLALSACTLPGANLPLFHLSPNEAVLGVGVHGEAGVRRLPQPESPCVAAQILLDPLIKYLNITSGKRVVVLVNNLGTLLGLELWAVVGEVVKELSQRGIAVDRVFATGFFTSLDMTGVQVCCIVIPDEERSLWLEAFDVAAGAPAWPGTSASLKPSDTPIADDDNDDAKPIEKRGPTLSLDFSALLAAILKSTAYALEASEEKLNLLDSGCGDGDCGSTLKRLAFEVLTRLRNGELFLDRPAALALQLARCAASAMGGTSGAIYSLLLTSAAKALDNVDDASNAQVWARVWRSALEGVQAYSTARVGDRTMFDALEPACDVFESCLKEKLSTKEALKLAVDAAIVGCDRTKNMKARAGRASYVDELELGDVDAGAYAVVVWLKALESCI